MENPNRIRPQWLDWLAMVAPAAIATLVSGYQVWGRVAFSSTRSSAVSRSEIIALDIMWSLIAWLVLCQLAHRTATASINMKRIDTFEPKGIT